jgi:hypothetical protein
MNTTSRATWSFWCQRSIFASGDMPNSICANSVPWSKQEAMRKLLLFVGLLSVALDLTFGQGTTSGSATKMVAIRAGLANYRAVESTSSAGDNAAAWTAYFDGTALKHIHEDSRQGDYGWAANEYWFENGVLFAYDSCGSRTITDPSRPARKEPITLHLGFDDSGSLTEQSKTVAGRSAPVDSTEVSGAKARAAFLAEKAARLAAARVVQATSVFRAPVSGVRGSSQLGSMLANPCLVVFLGL